MKTKILSLFVISTLAAGGIAAENAFKNIELVVEEAAGVDRSGWPVTFGVPFAKGQLKSADQLGIVTADGKALAQENRVVANWPDESIKWVHFDSQVDLPKNSKQTFRIEEKGANEIKLSAKLNVKKEGDGVSVDTGAISFNLSPNGGGVLENVRLANGETISKGGNHKLSFVEQAPTPNPPEKRGNWKRPIPEGAKVIELSASDNKAEIIIERQSALAATILVKGWYEGGGRKACRYDVRVTAFADKPYLKIQHTLIYTEDPEKFFISGLSYGIGLGGGVTAQIGGEGTTTHKMNPQQGGYLLAPGPEIMHNGILISNAAEKTVTYEVFEGGKKVSGASGKEPRGWVAVQTSNSGIAVAVRDFHHLHPKEISVDSHGVELGLWSPHANLMIDCSNPSYGEVIRTETRLGGCACGWAKTHEIWVAYHGTAAQEPALALNMVRAGQEPVYVIPNPVYVCATGAMGMLAPMNREAYPHFEIQHETFWAWIMKNSEVLHWDGFFNYGASLCEFENHVTRGTEGARNTWVWRDYAGWWNNDFDPNHQLWRAYVRSGERRLVKFAETMSRCVGDEIGVHYFNPDVPHAHPVGAGHRHDMSPWGAIPVTYGTDPQGNTDMWYLLGDLRARDVLRDYASWFAERCPDAYEVHAPGSVVARLGEALQDPALVKKADALFQKDIEECRGKPNFRTAGLVFMPALLALDITSNEDLRSALMFAAERYAGQPAASDSYNNYPGEILAWAYIQTKDAKYLEALKSRIPNWNRPRPGLEGDPWSDDWNALRARFGEWKKVNSTIGVLGRYPAILYAFQAAGLTEKDLLNVKPKK
jgi:hypothetical protein